MMKLIRDNIPEITKANGQPINYATIQNDALFYTVLKEKLTEEVTEFLNAETLEGRLEELADIQLIISYFIAEHLEDFETIYAEKLQEKGAFEKRYIGFFEDNIQ